RLELYRALTERILAQYAPEEVRTPPLVGYVWEPQLRERDPHLHHPAERVDRGRDVPYRVPGAVPDEEVVAAQVIQLHPGGVDGELERRAMIVVAVKVDVEDVALGVVVPAAQAAGNLRRLGVVQRRTAIDRWVVLQNHYGRRFARRFSLVGVRFEESARGVRQLPRRVVEPAVERRWVLDSHCGDRGYRVPPGVGQRRRRGRLREQHRGEQEHEATTSLTVGR